MRSRNKLCTPERHHRIHMLSGEADPDGGKALWGSGFLPTVYQGVEFRAKGEPVLFVNNPEGVNPQARRATLDTPSELNQLHRAEIGDPEISTRIEAYELAFRMQTSVPELTDISKEPGNCLSHKIRRHQQTL